MGEMTGEIRERYGRDEKHLSHSLSPLYKGFSIRLWERWRLF